jgi:hypothetical protein
LIGAESTSKFLLASQPIGKRIAIVCGVLIGLMGVVIVLSAAHGPANIPYGDVARLICAEWAYP